MKFIRVCFLSYCVFYSVLIHSQTVPGTLGSSNTVCASDNNGILNLTGYTGSIVRWEYSLNGASLWTAIANTSDSYNYINLLQTTYFRTIVQNTSFPEAKSNTIVITVNDTTKKGVASVLNVTECAGNTVKMTLSGFLGSILNWQYSIDNAATWTTIAASNDSINKYFSNVTGNTLFRAIVKNGICPAKASDSVKVIVLPPSVGGSVAANANVCEGANSNTISLTGQTGNIIRWESSPTNADPWTTINNTTTSFTYTNIQNSIYYRAISKSGNCLEMPSSSVFIKVDKASNAGFVSGTQTVCSNLNNGVLHLNGNNGNIVQWEFSVDGGTNWTTTPINTSTYSFTNIAQNTLYKAQVANGVCPPAYSNSFLVEVKPKPVVDFTFSPACQGKMMNFTNLSTGTNLYNWDFDDGNASAIYSPSHTYINAGVFQVKLTATSANGCIDSIRKGLTIFPKPTVNFNSIDSACGFTQLTFTNNTSIANGTINGYVWNFGDNSAFSNDVSPKHTYLVDNTYIVKLVANSDNNCKDSLSKSVQIFPKPLANYTTNNVCKKTTASFINTSYINGGGITYSWDFGDTKTSTLQSPNHNYILAGDYNVSLITASNHGCRDTVIKQITINEQPDLIINLGNSCHSKASNFTQTITPMVTNYLLNWNFGNGDSFTGNNPNYVYPVPGTYSVTATLTTDSGCVSSQTKISTIHPSPYIAFSFNNACDTDSVSITNQSTVSSGTNSYLWNFGNNTTSTAINPTLVYSLPNIYNIKLIATTNKGCIDSLSKPISIFDSPITNFSFTNACDGKPVVFKNTSTVKAGTIINNNWDFGDNSNSTIVNPTKQYLNFGTYQVSLTAISSNQCKSKITKTVNVYEGAVAKFSFVNQCLNQAIPFTNLTSLANGTYNSFWTFGDSTNSVVNSPYHLYQTAGLKNVNLTVTTSNGCRDSISKVIEVYALPIVIASNDTTIASGFKVKLNAIGAKTYAWSPAVGLDNPIISNPIANPYETTTYVVEGTNEKGCYSFDTVTVTIENNFIVVPYNIVTPNGNGKNDVWFVDNIERYPQNNLIIMDEWGVVVYKQEGYANTWEGRNMRGEILPDGTYFYILTFKENSKVYKGFITLLRNK